MAAFQLHFWKTGTGDRHGDVLHNTPAGMTETDPAARHMACAADIAAP
jgi:hypothetical protein